jgi:hypothetical protein
MYCSVSLDTEELRAKVILNSDFLFQLQLRITEARHAFCEMEEPLILNNKREILRHTTHYLPTSTPTALLTQEGVPYVPNFNTLPGEYEIPDNFFTILFVSAKASTSNMSVSSIQSWNSRQTMTNIAWTWIWA